MTSWQLYWITRLDNFSLSIGLFCVIAVFLSAAMCIVALLFYHDEEVEKAAKLLHGAKTSILVALVALGLDALVPTTKEMAAIIIVPRVANSEKVQDVGNRLYDLAVEWMEELAPEKAKQEGSKEGGKR